MLGHVIGCLILAVILSGCWYRHHQDKVKDAYDAYKRALRTSQIKNQKPPRVPSYAVGRLIAEAQRAAFRKPKPKHL